MAERKYYWIKLKKDFMNSDAVDFLMSQKNGAEYVVLYQMLCLMTVKTNGKLERQLNEVIIPYDAEKIQRDTKYFNIDTVRNALQLYIHLGLIYKDDNGCLSIADYENLVGSESGSAERVRRFRNSKALHCNDDVTDMKRISNELSNTDIEIDKEIDIDTDKEVINTNISCKKNSEIEVLNQKEMWFESFWEIYPKHQDKKKAKQKFLKLCKDEKKYQEIMQGLRNVLPVWAKKDTKYIPMPTTWLNGERWNDEVDLHMEELPF